MIGRFHEICQLIEFTHIFGYIAKFHLRSAAKNDVITCFGISYSFSVYFPALQSDFSWNRAATSGIYSLYLVLVGCT